MCPPSPPPLPSQILCDILESGDDFALVFWDDPRLRFGSIVLRKDCTAAFMLEDGTLVEFGVVPESVAARMAASPRVLAAFVKAKEIPILVELLVTRER